MFNKNELRSVMARHGETATDLANALGTSYSNLSKKMNAISDWTVTQVYQLKRHYNLSAEDIDRIFFNLECS